jgi:hypothetical protein
MMRSTPRRFTILHFSQIFLTLGRTFIAASNRVDDLAAVWIELGKLHADSGSADQSDDCVTEGGCDTRSNPSTIVEAHSEKSTGQNLFDDASCDIFLRSDPPFSFRLSR